MSYDYRIGLFREFGLAITGVTSFTGVKIAEVLGVRAERMSELDSIPEGAVLVHLAAATDPNIRETLQTNFQMDSDVVTFATRRLAGLVYASGNNVYPRGIELDICDARGPTDYYGASKRVGEALVSSLCTVPHAILRISDVFGAGQRRGNFFRALEFHIRGRQELEIHGEGKKLRSYIYAPELAHVMLHFAKEVRAGRQPPTPVNVAYAQPMSVAEIAAFVGSAAGLKVLRKPLPDDRSAEDVRTMRPSPLEGYTWRWSMESALEHYVEVCRGSELGISR